MKARILLVLVAGLLIVLACTACGSSNSDNSGYYDTTKQCNRIVNPHACEADNPAIELEREREPEQAQRERERLIDHLR